MQTQFQLDNYIDALINETHFLANLQDLISTLTSLCYMAVKVGIKSCRFAENVCSFVHAFPAGIVFTEQAQ